MELQCPKAKDQDLDADLVSLLGIPMRPIRSPGAPVASKLNKHPSGLGRSVIQNPLVLRLGGLVSGRIMV